MEKIFYKNSEGRLDDDWIDVVDSTETLEDGTEIKHTRREENPSPNTYGKYSEAVKYWCTERGLTVYDRGDYYEFAEPEPSPAPTLEEKAQAIRSQRDALLSESDKYALVDNYGKLTKEEQAELCAYRTQLRDMPEQASFPESVEFPKKPLFVKE